MEWKARKSKHGGPGTGGYSAETDGAELRVGEYEGHWYYLVTVRLAGNALTREEAQAAAEKLAKEIQQRYDFERR